MQDSRTIRMMFHGFFALLDTATVRHLAVGASVALVLVAAFALFQRATSDPGEHPDQWLTDAERNQLEQAIASLAADGAWVAGCLWDGDDRRITEELDIPPGQRQLYAGETSGGRSMAFAVVAGGGGGGEYQPHQGRGMFCLAPVERGP
jgi:hypothetical protein